MAMTATEPRPRLKPSGTAGPATSRAKVKKGAATAKARAKPKKKRWIKGPRRSKRVKERALDTESSELKINERLAKRKRKLTRRSQWKAREDNSWASGYSC
jgi:hypothetical protein